MDKLKQTTEKIRKQVPEICINENAQLIKFDHSVEYFKQYREITFEDLLIYMCQLDKWSFSITFKGNCAWIDDGKKNNLLWRLNKTLSQQSIETIEYIYDLIIDE